MISHAEAAAPPPPGGNLARRLVTGAILSAVSFYLIYLGSLPFLTEILVLGLIGAREFYSLAERKGLRPARRSGLAICALVLIAAHLTDELTCFRWMVLALLVLLVLMVFRGRKRASILLDAAATVLGIIYVGWLFSFLVLLRNVEGVFPVGDGSVSAGAALVVLLVTLNAFSDMGGYFVGRSFGKRKLFPAVSPKKTVEGAVGSVLASLGIAVIVGGFLQLELVHRLALGLLVPVAAQFGDLWESALKRDAGVKDSGTIMAGHGGVLDRFDSLAFATPVFYFYVMGFVL